VIRILVVDDEIQAVRLLKKFLVSKAYDVYTATNGWEALQQIKEVNPHIVLLDIIMPGMGGLDTLKAIKKINPKIAVIMVTALFDEELAKKALQLGADDYITKPFDLNDIENNVLVKMILPLD
jgi:two-component system, OmpR family, response regulator